MTSATLLLCIWPLPVSPALLVVVAMGLMEPQPCVPNEIPVVSCADLAPALRRLRAQYQAASGECSWNDRDIGSLEDSGVVELALGKSAGRPPQADGGKAQNDGKQRDYARESNQPPIGPRFLTAFCLITGGLIGAFFGINYLDEKRRVLRAALVGIGLIFPALGILLWMLTFDRRTWGWFL